MKHYEIKSGLGCHNFIDYSGQEELLKAILEWWQTIEKTAKTLNSIEFLVEGDSTCSAAVNWAYLTEETESKLNAFLRIPQPLPAPESSGRN